MNVERVVCIILDGDLDSDWNKSDEESESGFDSESFRMDRLSMGQGKVVDKCGSVVTQFFFDKMLKMVKTMAKTLVKMMGKTTTEIDLMIARFNIHFIIYTY